MERRGFNFRKDLPLFVLGLFFPTLLPLVARVAPGSRKPFSDLFALLPSKFPSLLVLLTTPGGPLLFVFF